MPFVHFFETEFRLAFFLINADGKKVKQTTTDEIQKTGS